MTITVRKCEAFLLNLQTRMPFRYGIAAMTRLPHLLLRLRLDVDGREQVGVAAEHLPPKWFTKDPAVPFRDDVAAMLRVIESALAIAQQVGPAPTVFELWHRVYAGQKVWAGAQYPPLLWGLGVSLVERALIDAYCRATQTTLARAVRDNRLGIRLTEIYPALAGVEPRDFLPPQPLDTILVRHTVGLTDPLTDAEIPAAERLDDGLPQSLAATIRAYGLTHFKIKLGGDTAHDADRLRHIAGLLGEREFAFTLDANEQYREVAAVRELWETLSGDALLASFLRRLMFVEQPLHRDVALNHETRRALLAWHGRPPIIIDESDGELGALATALESGYVGTSHKNCKGVFKGLANAGLLAQRRRADPGGQYILSAEDLTTIGPVALLQDLAVIATLGIDQAERNGHHYFRGLNALPPQLQQQMLAHHGDLYRQHERGFATMQIARGRISTGSVVAAPFGCGCEVDIGGFTPLAQWRFDSLMAEI